MQINTWIDVKEIMIETLGELGVQIDGEDGDIDINSYGIDSIIYISFIVSLEEKMQISFPDELLLYESFSSINGFAHLLITLLHEQNYADINTY